MDKSTLSNAEQGRRHFLFRLGLLPVAAFLPGCLPVPRSPPTGGIWDPTRCEVDWVPDVAHPVSWGCHNLTAQNGAPRDMLVYYPSCQMNRARIGLEPPYDPASAAPMLRLNAHRWPVVLFYHGRMPTGVAHDAWHQMWRRLASSLACRGYVVIVPRHAAEAIPTQDHVALVMADLEWVRNSWQESEWTTSDLQLTAVAGHSNGALLAAAVAAKYPGFGAFVSLGGQHKQPEATLNVGMVKAPSFYMWTRSNLLEDIEVLWNSLDAPRYAAVYGGTHFDYLEAADTGSLPRGTCTHMAGVASDLVTLFVASQLRPPGWPKIPLGLTRPQPQLTPRQQPYAVGQFNSLDEIATRPGCKVSLRWNFAGTTGCRSLTVGPSPECGTLVPQA